MVGGGGGGWILGCLVWRVRDGVAGSRLRGWGVSHEGRLERRVGAEGLLFKEGSSGFRRNN